MLLADGIGYKVSVWRLRWSMRYAHVRAGSSLALDILEEVRAVLSMLAEVEEGGCVVSP